MGFLQLKYSMLMSPPAVLMLICQHFVYQECRVQSVVSESMKQLEFPLTIIRLDLMITLGILLFILLGINVKPRRKNICLALASVIGPLTIVTAFAAYSHGREYSSLNNDTTNLSRIHSHIINADHGNVYLHNLQDLYQKLQKKLHCCGLTNYTGCTGISKVPLMMMASKNINNKMNPGSLSVSVHNDNSNGNPNGHSNFQLENQDSSSFNVKFLDKRNVGVQEKDEDEDADEGERPEKNKKNYSRMDIQLEKNLFLRKNNDGNQKVPSELDFMNQFDKGRERCTNSCEDDGLTTCVEEIRTGGEDCALAIPWAIIVSFIIFIYSTLVMWFHLKENDDLKCCCCSDPDPQLNQFSLTT